MKAIKGDEKEEAKKRFSLKRKFVAVALVIFVSTIFVAPVSAAELHVGPGQTYSTIQAAINAAGTDDTIIVHDGTYNENVIVNKSDITIRSDNGSAVTIIKSNATDKHVVNITDRVNVTLQGFEIRDARGTIGNQHVAGIYMKSASDCNISDNFVTNISATGIGSYAHGIWLYNSNNNTFSSSTIISNVNGDYYANGIWLRYSDNNSFSSSTTISNVNAKYEAYGIVLVLSDDNKFSSSTTISYINATLYHAYGIELKSSDDNKFSSSTSISNINANWDAYGILLYYYSNNNTFSSSTTVSNINATAGDAYGIALESSDDNTFSSSTSISNITAGYEAYGIRLQNSHDNKFSSSTISNLNAADDETFGIRLQGSNNNRFSSSISISYLDSSSQNTYGVRLQDSDDNTFNSSTSISNLNANWNAYGIGLGDDSDDNEFYDCTISDLTAGGNIYGVKIIEVSDHNTISRGRISSHIKYGVYMENCMWNSILDSEISDSEYGIYIYDKPCSHIMSGNTIYGNDFGIYLYDTWDNIITENEIRDNGEGIRVINSYNNTIERNMIVNNKGGDGTGVHITDGSDENEIHGNCFIDNVPQAWDDLIIKKSNNWDRNFWDPTPGEPEDPYLIPGAAGSRDNNPLRYCPLIPAKVPVLTPIGIIALVGLLSVVLAVSIRIRRKK